jgi:hypothetical protein
MYFAGSTDPFARVTVMNPAVKPCWPSLDNPTRAGVHVTFASAFAGFAFSASIAF